MIPHRFPVTLLVYCTICGVTVVDFFSQASHTAEGIALAGLQSALFIVVVTAVFVAGGQIWQLICSRGNSGGESP